MLPKLTYGSKATCYSFSSAAKGPFDEPLPQSRIHKLEGHFIYLHMYSATAVCAHVRPLLTVPMYCISLGAQQLT